MWIAELWRYPVKSMGGERLEVTEVTDRGIVGDRVVHVSGPGGRIVTSRTHPRLLGLHGTLGPDGEPLVDHRPWSSRESAAAVRAAAGPAPDTQEQDLSVLRRIAAEFGGRMALDCGAVSGGRIAVGDPVELMEGGEAA